jgi:hypothetical protein
MLINEEVNLDLFPAGDETISCDPENQYTIGDLHGNAIKLLYLLIRQNFLKMSPENYQEILDIYYKDTCTLTAEDILRFKEIISQAELNPNAGKIRLIGDVLADRGQCDYYTLVILNALKGQVTLEILFSNHDLEFLLKCEWGMRFDTENALLDSSVTPSMHAVQYLIDKNIITRQEILEMLDTAYKPYLKALSYSFPQNEPRINIYTHAYIGKTAPELLKVIAAMSKKLGIPYACKTNIELIRSIDAINNAFSVHVRNNSLNTICHPMQDVYNIDIENNPFVFVAWNRQYWVILFPTKEGGKKSCLVFFHGHDDKGPELQGPYVFCLDTILGKLSTPECRIGKLRVFFSQDRTELKAKKKTENPPVKENPEDAQAKEKPADAEEKSFGKEENPNTYPNSYAAYAASLGKGVIRPKAVRPEKPQAAAAPAPLPEPEEKFTLSL